MKAIVCPQCGALIKTVSNKDKLGLCEYCDAKVILPNEPEPRPENDAPEQPLSPFQQHQENYRKVHERAAKYDAPYTYPQPERNPVGYILFALFALVGVITFIGVNSQSCRSRSTAEQPKSPLKAVNTPNIQYPVSTPTPRISYQVRIQWEGKYDMENYVQPEIDHSKLPSFDEKELKKTVFKNRAVQVKITIDTDGAASEAAAISGHPVLKEAAAEAARRTIFNSREKPTNRILTYYFHLTGVN